MSEESCNSSAYERGVICSRAIAQSVDIEKKVHGTDIREFIEKYGLIR